MKRKAISTDAFRRAILKAISALDYLPVAERFHRMHLPFSAKNWEDQSRLLQGTIHYAGHFFAVTVENQACVDEPSDLRVTVFFRYLSKMRERSGNTRISLSIQIALKTTSSASIHASAPPNDHISHGSFALSACPYALLPFLLLPYRIRF